MICSSRGNSFASMYGCYVIKQMVNSTSHTIELRMHAGRWTKYYEWPEKQARKLVVAFAFSFFHLVFFCFRALQQASYHIHLCTQLEVVYSQKWFSPYRSNVDRLVCVTSWGTQKEPGNPKLMEYLLKPLMMAGFIHDMALMERMLMETKLNYTVVRPPGLKNGE